MTKTAVVQAMEQRAHAILSASGSPIWLACTPSARFQEQFPDTETEYSAEGTWAHSVASHRLLKFLGRQTEFEKERDIPGFDKFANAASDEAINAYVRRCIIAIQQARQEDPAAIILVEQKLDYSPWVPEGFGTGDLVIIWKTKEGPVRARVRDLKFGKGKFVEVDDNSQLKLYGLGAYHAFAFLYDVEEIVIEIDQPRMNNIEGMDPIGAKDLLSWAETVVQRRAALAWEGKGEYVPGDHCTWCRGKNQCKARLDAVADLADAAFEPENQDPNKLTPEQLAKYIPRLAALKTWASNLQKFALQQALTGDVKWPGLKLVTGRANRKIVNPGGLLAALELEGIDRELVLEMPRERELMGITALEKVVGKKAFASISEGFVEKPAGKPALVPEDDPREEYVPTSADAAFVDEEEEE